MDHRRLTSSQILAAAPRRPRLIFVFGSTAFLVVLAVRQ